MERFCYMRYSPKSEQDRYGYPNNSPIIPVVELDKCIYIVTAKCASTTIQAAIGKAKYMPLSEVKEINKTKPAIRFLRNPYTRLLSCWQWWVRTRENRRLFNIEGIYLGQPFDKFIETIVKIPFKLSDQHFIPLSACLFDLNYSFISKVEMFNDHWRIMANEYNLPLNIKSKAVTGISNHINDYYTPRLIKLVNKKYKNDFVNFEYKKINYE